MTTDKKYQATAASVQPAENGYVLHLHTFDAALVFVAKDMNEVCEILRDADIRVMARSLGEHVGRIGGGPMLEQGNRRRYADETVPTPDMTTGMSAAAFAQPR